MDRFSEEIGEQHRAIGKLNKSFGKDFRIFGGIESDILADGSLDYPDDVLGATPTSLATWFLPQQDVRLGRSPHHSAQTDA